MSMNIFKKIQRGIWVSFLFFLLFMNSVQAETTAPSPSPTPLPIEEEEELVEDLKEPPVPPTLLEKIQEARTMLESALPLYSQTKRSVGVRSLSQGNSGNEVLLAQKKLQELGFFPKTTKANGVFGPTTLRAVKIFQKSEKIIPQNGVIGPKTIAALQKRGLAITPTGALQREWRDTVPLDREVLLALWKPETNEIKTARVTLTARKKGKNTTYSVANHTLPFIIKRISGTGVNVHYSVISPAGYHVIANRFPIFDEDPGTRGTFPPHEVVYIPYSTAIHTPEIVDAGRQYLDTIVAEALADLSIKRVASKTGGGLVSDIVDPNELKNIAIIEHVDHAEFKRAVDKKIVVDKVFAILGANREHAYRFAGSSKGALGLAQFIEKTYYTIRNKYPTAKLIPQFEEGMNDHVNAIKAMALYQDTTDSALEKYVHETLGDEITDVASLMAEVRAASYNGGVSRVKSAIKKFGVDWQIALKGLRAETKVYLEKFKAVRELLIL